VCHTTPLLYYPYPYIWVLHISISMIYIHLQQVLLSHLAFLGFDSLWNTPLGKCYNSRSMRLWILLWLLGLSLVFSGVIARTHNLVMTLINANSQTTNPPRTRHNFTMPSFEQVEPFSSNARTICSILPRSLTWSSPMHQLLVHDKVLLLLHHEDRTWFRCSSGPSNQACLSLHHPKRHSS
jgi:hypothetical protein